MKILIFGGTGFIGKNLIENIDHNDSILIVSHKPKIKIKNYNNIKYINHDLQRPLSKKIIRFQPHIIYNLAWYGIPNFNLINCMINVKISINIIDSLTKFKNLRNVIFSGSCQEYLPSIKKINEKSKLNMTNDFSITKNFIKNYFIYFCKTNKIKYIWVSIFYVYGKYQRKASLLPYLINSIKNNKKIKINNINFKCDYINIMDVISFLLLQKSNYNKSGIYNLGFSKLYTVSEIIKCTEKILNKKINITNMNLQNNISANNENEYLLSDISKIKRNFNWRPKISLEKGIKNYINNEF